MCGLGPFDSPSIKAKVARLPFRMSQYNSPFFPPPRSTGFFQICLITHEEIDLSVSVATKLVFASVKIMLWMAAILSVNQVSVTDMSGK